MDNLRITPPWKIALSHWFIAGFCSQFFINHFTLSLLMRILAVDYDTSALLNLLMTPLTYGLGVLISARYLHRRYDLGNSLEIVWLSTWLLVIVSGGARIHNFIYGLMSPTFVALNYYITLDNLAFVLGVISFYIISKKYLRT